MKTKSIFIQFLFIHLYYFSLVFFFLFLFFAGIFIATAAHGAYCFSFFEQFPAPHFSDGRTKKRLAEEKEAAEEEDNDEALQLYNCECFEFFSCVRQFYSQLVQAAVQIFAQSSAQWQSGLSFCRCCRCSFCFVFYFGFGPLGANWVSTRRRRWTNRQTAIERDKETDRQRHSQSVSSSGSQRRNEKRDEASSKILNNRCNDLSIYL